MPAGLRWALGAVLGLLGLVGALALTGGVAAMAYVGPDDTVPLLDQRLGTTGVALVTAPDLIDVRGPTVHVTASSAPSRDTVVFLGVAPTDEAVDYLREAGRSEITAYRWRTGATMTDHPGRVPVAAPADLDIWSAHEQGRDAATLSWTLPDGRYSLVVMRADGRSLGTVTVSVGLQLSGLYATAASVAAGGLLVLLLAVGGLLRVRPRRSPGLA